MSPERHRPWDPLGLVVVRFAGSLARRNSRFFPLAAAAMSAAERRPDPPLARFGRRHPLTGGLLGAVVFTVAMMAVFDALTLFRHVDYIAVISGIGGGFVGLVAGWSFSYTKRTGQRPPY